MQLTLTGWVEKINWTEKITCKIFTGRSKNKILTDKKIYLNGTTKYICIDIPPKSISLLQLLPI
jgi:hypothetical protein